MSQQQQKQKTQSQTGKQQKTQSQTGKQLTKFPTVYQQIKSYLTPEYIPDDNLRIQALQDLQKLACVDFRNCPTTIKYPYDMPCFPINKFRSVEDVKKAGLDYREKCLYTHTKGIITLTGKQLNKRILLAGTRPVRYALVTAVRNYDEKKRQQQATRLQKLP